MALKKFIKFDTEKGYLDNKDDINYFATSQMRHVAFGNMLGDFDENGLYVINQKLVEELIAMPKVIVEIMDDSDLIRSKVKADSFFHFILTVEDNKASLKLLEKMYYQSNRDFNSGVYSDINEYVLDEVLIPDKDFDRNALYEKYNISTENDGEALSIFDMDEVSIALYYNLVHKLKTNYLVQNELILKEKELEAIEADYFEEVLAVLNEFEEYGNTVRNTVQDNLVEKHSFMIISKPFFQQTINEVLDSCMEQYMHMLSQEQQEEFLTKLRTIKANYYEKFKQLIPVELAVKSGVRFDANQVKEQGIIGSLAQEIATKGYTSSDVRKIVINDDELQLTISKLKELVKENEEACKRDNANAKDITKGRKLTGEFYTELDNKKKTNMLSPDTTLIKSAIDEKAAKVDKQEKKVEVKAQNNASKVDTKKKATSNTKPVVKKPTVKAVGSTKSTKQKPVAKKTTTASKNSTKKTSTNVQQSTLKFIYGSGASNKKENATENQMDLAQQNKLARLREARDEVRLNVSNVRTRTPRERISENNNEIHL